MNTQRFPQNGSSAARGLTLAQAWAAWRELHQERYQRDAPLLFASNPERSPASRALATHARSD